MLSALGTWLLGLVRRKPPPSGARWRWALVAVRDVIAAVDVSRAAGEHRWTWERLGYSPMLTTTAYVGAIGLALVASEADHQLWGVSPDTGLRHRYVA